MEMCKRIQSEPHNANPTKANRIDIENNLGVRFFDGGLNVLVSICQGHICLSGSGRSQIAHSDGRG
jgi:hypothetical protein